MGLQKIRIEMSGKTVGRLTVLSFAGRTNNGGASWKCRCVCGNKTTVAGYLLRSGQVVSCGCYHRERTGDVHRKHGKCRTAEYRAWVGMIQRCENTNNPKYKDYGARGIRVCKRWRHDFQTFLNDMGVRPRNKTSIDRIDNDGNYEPQNCRWASAQEQGDNQRRTTRLTHLGKTQTLTEWSKETGLRAGMIYDRIHLLGWSVERALRPHPKTKLSVEQVKDIKQRLKGGSEFLRAIARSYNVSVPTITAIRDGVIWKGVH